ncbi:MAG: crossover junction endodeoxyribonuclease RuvC [Chlorobiaceae bacterium]|nr:crossover junction endodeoxyribonuclease RuvC [Chlorobiaceae bacterium]
MVVLGVDPGSLYTGYGIIRNDEAGFHVLACGVIRLHRKKSYAERIGEIYRELDLVIEAYRPASVALETVFLNRNVQSALKLGQVRGAIIALAMNRQMDLREYAPREVKAAVTGTGSASKEQVAVMVRAMLRFDAATATLDMTDALGIAMCDLLKTGGQQSPDIRTRSGSGSQKRKNWSQFVESRPDMVVR